MRGGAIAGPVLAAAIVVGLGYLVTQTSEGREDLVELAVILLGTLLLTVVLYERRVPRAPKKRTFRRTPDSHW